MDEQHNPLKSELKFLERLSIEELEALLKLSGDPNDVELLFDTVFGTKHAGACPLLN